MAKPHKADPKHDAPAWWTSDCWSTPDDVFAEATKRWGPFDLDVCASALNHKCKRYFTIEQNALAQDWTCKRAWMNPPYSHPGLWLDYAVKQVALRNVRERLVALLPGDISTGWFHTYVMGYAAHWEPIRGRIRFIGWKGTPIGSPKLGNVWAVYEP